MMKIYIVRHGQTEMNLKHVLQGNSDSPLTEKGIASQESFEDIVEHIEEELSEGISEEELHIFYKVLDQINQNVKKYEVR